MLLATSQDAHHSRNKGFKRVWVTWRATLPGPARYGKEPVRRRLGPNPGAGQITLAASRHADTLKKRWSEM